MTETTGQPVEFGELPPDGRSVVDLARVRAQLQARPSDWAKVRTMDTRQRALSCASNLRRGAMPKPAFEVTVRNCDVWARYVGDQS